MAIALVIAAHPDDNFLGSGCTRRKLTRQGWKIVELILWGGRGTAYDNAQDQFPLIETVKRIEEKLAEVSPERVYTHSASDLNVDHNICHKAVLAATRPMPKCCVKEIYCFETASSTEWNFTGNQFRPNVFEEITAEDLKYKLDMLEKLYASEMRNFPHPRSPKYIRACAERWGGVIGVPLAEAFELVRLIR